MKVTPITDSADYLFEQLNAENLSLRREVEKYKKMVEKAWAEHDPAILKMAKEIDSLHRENTLLKRFIEGYASEGVISAQDLLAKLKGAE